jgi:hypothetical protein
MTDDPKDVSFSSVLLVENGYTKDLWRTVHITTNPVGKKEKIVYVNFKVGEKNFSIELSTNESREFASILRAASDSIEQFQDLE